MGPLSPRKLLLPIHSPPSWSPYFDHYLRVNLSNCPKQRYGALYRSGLFGDLGRLGQPRARDTAQVLDQGEAGWPCC